MPEITVPCWKIPLLPVASMRIDQTDAVHSQKRLRPDAPSPDPDAWTGPHLQTTMLNVFAVISRRLVQQVFYGWWVVGASFAIQALNSGLLYSGFGVYFVPLQNEFGWSRTLLATGFSVNRIESTLLGPIQGWATDKFGPRIMVVIGVVIFGSGFMAFSQTNSIAWFFFSFFLLAIGSSLGGFLPTTATIINWFARKRALAMGIAMSGMGLGGAMIPILAWSITANGWRTTAFASGLLVWLVGIPAGMLLRHKPEPYGYLPDGGDKPILLKHRKPDNLPTPTGQRSKTDVPEYSFTPWEATHTSAFWLLSAGHASAMLGVSAVNVHQVPHMVQQLGLSLTEAGSIVALLLIMTIIGQISGGLIADRIDKRAILGSCMLGHTAGLLLLAYASTPFQIILFAIVQGLAWGARGPTQSAIRADYFGRNSYATIIGLSSVIVSSGTIVSPIITGWMADIEGGNYTLPFTILATLTGFGSLFFLFVHKPIPSRKPPSIHVTGASQDNVSAKSSGD